MAEPDAYTKHIILAIVRYRMDIHAINNLSIVKIFGYTERNRCDIGELIRAGKASELEHFSESEVAAKGEDLLVVKFSDDGGKWHYTLLYDSDELWQDPVVIDLFEV